MDLEVINRVNFAVLFCLTGGLVEICQKYVAHNSNNTLPNDSVVRVWYTDSRVSAVCTLRVKMDTFLMVFEL